MPTFLSGFAISGSILQKGLITSKNLTETETTKFYVRHQEIYLFARFSHYQLFSK